MRILGLAVLLLACKGGPSAIDAGRDAVLADEAGLDASDLDASAPDAADAGPPIDGHVTGPARDATRPIAPLSTSRVSSRRPLLRWSLEVGAADAHVELCADRACTNVLTAFDERASEGAPSVDLPVGVVFWRVVPRVGGELRTPSVVWQMTIPATSAPVAHAWGSTTDLDGDGLSDAIATAGFMPSVVRVMPGATTGIDAARTITLTEPSVGGQGFGASTASAGDVNGDGVADLLVSGGRGTDGGPGAVYVYMGTTRGLRAAPDVTLRPSDPDDAYFGSPIGAGDLDGDGYGDVAVASSVRVAPDQYRAYVVAYLGGPEGLSSTPVSRTDATTLTLGTSSIAAPGDVTGDGLADVMFGGHEVAHVLAGSASGLATTATLTGLRDLDSTSVSAAGDVNADGWPDVLVGGFVWSSTEAYTTQSLFLGSASGLASTPTIELRGGSVFTTFDGGGAGDLDGDGYDDVVLVRTDVDAGGSSLFVYAGNATGIADAETIPFPGMPSETIVRCGLGGDVDGDTRADVVLAFSSHVVLMAGYVGTPTLLPFGPQLAL